MTSKRKSEPTAHDAGRYSYDGLDRVIHEKARLGILASLATNEGLAFTDLKELCALTDGNLSRHLAVLHEAGLVKMRKSGRGPRAQTTYSLTAKGRRRFVDYIDVLERVVADAQDAPPAKRTKRSGSTNWSPA